MNKSRFLIAAAIVLVLINIGTLAFLLLSFKKDDRGGPPPPGRAADFIIEQLQLDPAQQEKFAELRMQHRNAMMSAHREDRRLHDMYFDLLKTDHADKKQADSIFRLIANQRMIMDEATFAHFEALRKLCRDDQKQLFDDTIDEIARRIGGPKAPPPPGGPPPPEH